MPGIPHSLSNLELDPRTTVQPHPSSANDTSAFGVDVICAWPVSGQYGPGSRTLYYVLVAACIFARKVDWLRNACLAAALLFPVIAALHGIVLATVHIDGAVDLDIYGAFQFCAIAILVAPMTARVSSTYFKDHGRNAIFVWSVFVVAGLLSLIVEFFRIETFHCTHDDAGNKISSDPDRFPFGHASCGLICDQDRGPFSPVRGGSADNIYVVPAPTKLNSHAAILVAAACCIPGVLLAASLGFQLFKNSSATRWGKGALNMRASIVIVQPDNGLSQPVMGLLEPLGTCARIGIIRLHAEKNTDGSISPMANEVCTHIENVTDSHLVEPLHAFGSTCLLQHLHRQSTLTKYAFEIRGSQIQVLEVNVNVSEADTTDAISRVYADLMALEREDVKSIIVEGAAHGNVPEKVLTRLSNDSQIRQSNTPEMRKSRVSESLGKYLQIVLFGGAVFAILVAGERNLFSSQMRYQTEPMANVGQWAPAIGTALAVLGSVWVLLADAVQKERRAMYSQEPRSLTLASRLVREVATGLIGLGDLLRPARKHFDDSGFKRSTAEYPTVPGEGGRNEHLDRTMTKYAGSTRASGDSIRSVPSGAPSNTPHGANLIERKSSNTGPREGQRHRSDTLEIPRQLSPVYLPQRSSTQDGLSSSPLTLEPVSTLHESRDVNTPDIVIQHQGSAK
ncbi:hypothetical protein KC318_g1365 [Hortaea werneckii]|uniref:Uncharacterized protein n=1 Tax=Hortaea werneckii TaxID=91943 RepID=A0A3M7BAI1_HORWE|nr:hypothetical protein KC334_g3664 [Hortaea werneckii]KAI7023266.1 hypothetical protein KC355_g1780 [Hortaea werneckii]KAI7674791.1 hypothetical protein KC318_g1365 [Hortaea werneckii]RMY25213.1 hypothetical protein D0867_00866 [Hortaea werneckii]RMY36430.1 hypothetical protein D0866_03938 [Hortaea werneckii]